MSRSTLSEPDCSGMCSEGITLGVSAIASMTSSVNSAGCGEVNRTRSRPSMSPQARSSLENACRSPNSTPYALTFWPSRVTSVTPSSTSARISARISPGRRSFSLPRRLGTMQNVQVLLQPTETDTQAAYADSRRLLRDRGAVLLGQAAPDRDLHPGGACLDRREMAEVAVELVVGVLPHR